MPNEPDNIKLYVKGCRLFIEVHLDGDCGLSRSGKMRLVATTSGNMPLRDIEGAHEANRDISRYKLTMLLTKAKV